jgi:hypothetical protein
MVSFLLPLQEQYLTIEVESEVPQRCFYRVRGMLFFDREFEVTQNKTEFVASNPFFTQFLQQCKDITLCDKYQKWLSQCHKFDHEVGFSSFLLSSIIFVA